MSKKIEVGMMVRIAGLDKFSFDPAYKAIRIHEGHEGVVRHETVSEMDHPAYEIDGIEGRVFPPEVLIPIGPPEESDDIKATREQGAPSFSKMMEGLKQREEVA